MTFQPVVPLSGSAGWAFLERTRTAQQAAYSESAPVASAVADFRDRIGGVSTAADLVADRRLLSVALGAFGLDDDIGNRFFIRKVLEEGTNSETSLANRLSDRRYFALAEAFGFDRPETSPVADPAFADRIVSLYQTRGFERALGASNPDMRLVLAFQRDFPDLAAQRNTDDGLWFSVMGTPPVREIFERAFRLPASVGALDIDRQLDIFKERSRAVLGSDDLTRVAGSDLQERLIERFLASGDLIDGPAVTVRGSAALAILSARPYFA